MCSGGKMKKILLILLWGVVIFSAVAEENKKQASEERFVNPLFYKGMINFRKEPNFVKITPTSYYIQNCYGYRTSARCEMLKNTEDIVILKCLHLPEDRNDEQALIITGYDNKPQIWTYKFLIRWKEFQTSKEGTYVREISYYQDEKEPTSYINFLIYDSEQQLTEHWQDILRTFKEKDAEKKTEN